MTKAPLMRAQCQLFPLMIGKAFKINIFATLSAMRLCPRCLRGGLARDKCDGVRGGKGDLP